jgi:hypothetical protein
MTKFFNSGFYRYVSQMNPKKYSILGGFSDRRPEKNAAAD